MKHLILGYNILQYMWIRKSFGFLLKHFDKQRVSINDLTQLLIKEKGCSSF